MLSVIWIPSECHGEYNWVNENIAVGPDLYNDDNIEELIEEGIDNILCVHRSSLIYSPEKFNINFKQVQLADCELIPLEKVIEAIDFIDEIIQDNQKVYVHCQMGISRSPTIIMLYLIAKRGFNFSDAFAELAKVRLSINPHPNLINYDLIIDLINHYK